MDVSFGSVKIAFSITSCIVALAVCSADAIALEYKVSKVQGQTIVSANANLSSSNFDQDTKVDAVFAAKEVMQKDPTITRVACRFYYPDRVNYAEVVVTAGDVLAFATGNLPKEDLLSSLQVRKVVAKANSSESASATKTFDASDFTFQYASSWIAVPPQQNPLSGADEVVVAQLGASNSVYKSKITLEKYKPIMPLEKRAAAESRLNRGSVVANLRIGAKGNIPALTWVGRQRTPFGTVFSRRVYFMMKGNQYSISLACVESESKQLEPDLSYVLSTIK